MSSLKKFLPLIVALAPLCSSFAPLNHPSISSRASSSIIGISTKLQVAKHDVNLFEDRTKPKISKNNNNGIDNMFERVGKVATSALLALTLSFSAISSPFAADFTSVPSANAADGAAIGLCLIKKCPGYLAKCISNPNCLANVICINTCNGKPDEAGCQVDCGNTFENDVVGEFNKCAVSDMDCVPQKPDDVVTRYHRRINLSSHSIPTFGMDGGILPPGRISYSMFSPVRYISSRLPSLGSSLAS